MTAPGHDVDLVLRCEGLGKRYARGSSRHHLRDLAPRSGPDLVSGAEGFDALVDVSFEVGAGEALGVVGPNGAGKTTLLKAASGVLRPSTGRICTRGRVASVIELGVGFHPDLSGTENVRLAASLHGMGRAATARVLDRVVAFAGVGDAMDTPTKWYSTGMLARLGFALATHLEADLLLVDEVLSVGDQEFRQRCVERLLDLRDGGVALVLVSHDLLLVDLLCGRALRLEGGRVVDLGPSHAVLDRYGGVGSASGSAWASGPAVLREVRMRPARVRTGEGFEVVAQVEVLRPLPAVELELRVRPRLPGIDVAPTANTLALHSQVVLDVADHQGLLEVVGSIERLPTSGGAYECEVVLRGPGPGAPLGIADARLDVVGPREPHPMVVLDAEWTVRRDGGVGG